MIGEICKSPNLKNILRLKKEHNPILYNIIVASGLPAVLNTSFNYQEPIVETPDNALETYANMGHVDALIIGDEIYER